MSRDPEDTDLFGPLKDLLDDLGFSSRKTSKARTDDTRPKQLRVGTFRLILVVELQSLKIREIVQYARDGKLYVVDTLVPKVKLRRVDAGEIEPFSALKQLDRLQEFYVQIG